MLQVNILYRRPCQLVTLMEFYSSGSRQTNVLRIVERTCVTVRHKLDREKRLMKRIKKFK